MKKKLIIVLSLLLVAAIVWLTSVIINYAEAADDNPIINDEFEAVIEDGWRSDVHTAVVFLDIRPTDEEINERFAENTGKAPSYYLDFESASALAVEEIKKKAAAEGKEPDLSKDNIEITVSEIASECHDELHRIAETIEIERINAFADKYVNKEKSRIGVWLNLLEGEAGNALLVETTRAEIERLSEKPGVIQITNAYGMHAPAAGLPVFD